MKKHTSNSLRFIPAALGLAFCLLANNANAQSQYFTTVANNTTYSWDAANWNASGSAGNTAPYTFNWTAGDFARFYNGAGDNYTVTVNASESMTGLYMGSGSSSTTVNINDFGNGTGSLNVVANSSQASQNGFSWLTQGFFNNSGTVSINAQIAGSGGVEEEGGGGGTGQLQLYGINTFTGGFLAISSTSYIEFNNNNSFGALSSQIGFDGTTFAIMQNNGPSTVNIANPVQTIGATGVDFIGNGVTYSGNWYLGGGASAINIRNNGVGTTVTLSGALSATSGTVTYSGANGGTIVLSGANTYTGPTAVGVSGDTNFRLTLGAANTIASSSRVIMAGGTLDPDGFHHVMSSTTLGLTASSTIDFTSGAAEMDFANSSGVAWIAALTLNLVATGHGNWNQNGDHLEIGTDATGLTSAQLAEIEFNGTDLGDAAIDANGYIYDTAQPIPEPSTVVLSLLGLGALWTIRRRTA